MGKGQPDTLPLLTLTEPNAEALHSPVEMPHHVLMATDDAHHQATYRSRLAAAGNVRLDTHISAGAAAALAALAQRDGASVRNVVETAIINQHKGSHMNTTHPQRPLGMTAAEAAELDRFKEALPTSLIASEQARAAHAFNGGDAGAQRKAAFDTALRASGNIHSK